MPDAGSTGTAEQREVAGTGARNIVSPEVGARRLSSPKMGRGSAGVKTAIDRRREELEEDFYRLGHELVSSVTLDTMGKKERDFRLALQRLSRCNLSQDAYEQALKFVSNVKIQKKARLVELLAGDILMKLNIVEEPNEEYDALLQTDGKLGELEKEIFDIGRKMCTTKDFDVFLDERSNFVTSSQNMIEYLKDHMSAKNTIRRFVARCQLLAQVQHARFLARKLVSLQGGDN